jgi:hypothetical protein
VRMEYASKIWQQRKLNWLPEQHIRMLARARRSCCHVVKFQNGCHSATNQKAHWNNGTQRYQHEPGNGNANSVQLILHVLFTHQLVLRSSSG